MESKNGAVLCLSCALCSLTLVQLSLTFFPCILKKHSGQHFTLKMAETEPRMENGLSRRKRVPFPILPMLLG